MDVFGWNRPRLSAGHRLRRGAGIQEVGVPMHEPAWTGGFFGRVGLIVPAVLAPVGETALLRAVSPENAALGPQATAPPPLDVFHDLRWVSVFHNSWLTFGVELAAVVVLRCLWMAWVVQRSWPSEAGATPAMAGAARRAVLFYALAMVLFVPWVVLLFGMAFSHLSFLFFAALPPAIAIAAILHRGAIARTSGGRIGWRPTWRSVAWILGSFVWLTLAGGVAGSGSLSLALLAAAIAGLLNARALYGVVQDVALGRSHRALTALTPVLVASVFALTVGGSAIGFALASHPQRASGLGPLPSETPGQHPVLVATGLHSHYDSSAPLRLPNGYVGWRFSYRGLGSGNRPLPYWPRDTEQSLAVSAGFMAQQVRTLAHAYREPVTIVAESEGAMVARTFLLHQYRPSSHTVDRLITLDMLPGESNVYFPARGSQGWGVASGWGLRGLANLLGGISRLRLSVDSGLGRDVTDCRASLTELAGAPPPAGVRQVAFESLADMVDPAASPPGVPVYLVSAPHGGLMGRLQVQDLIDGILGGDPSLRGSTRQSLLANLVTAGARPWETPTLPVTLDPAGVCVSS